MSYLVSNSKTNMFKSIFLKTCNLVIFCAFLFSTLILFTFTIDTNAQSLTLNRSNLIPLYSNSNNDFSADRINLIFSYSNQIPENSDLGVLTEKYLQSNGQGAGSSIFGFFTVSPYKENKNKFNIWVLNKLLTDAQADNLATDVSLPSNSFNLQNVVPIYVAKSPVPNSRSYSTLAKSLQDIVTKKPKYFATGGVNRSYLYNSNGTVDLFAPETLAHELGHAIFGLTDEYVEANSPFFVSQKPSCAIDQTMANKWWGNLNGTVDPFYDTFKNNRIALNMTYPPVTDITIGNITGAGCLSSVDSGQIRSSVNSMMNYHYTLPVLGTVNTAHVNGILDLFSGTTTVFPKPTNSANQPPFVSTDNELNLSKVTDEACAAVDDETNPNPNFVKITCKLKTSQLPNSNTNGNFHWQIIKLAAPGSINTYELASNYKECNLLTNPSELFCSSFVVDKLVVKEFTAVYYFDGQEYLNSPSDWNVDSILALNNSSSSPSSSSSSSSSSISSNSSSSSSSSSSLSSLSNSSLSSSSLSSSSSSSISSSSSSLSSSSSSSSSISPSSFSSSNLSSSALSSVQNSLSLSSSVSSSRFSSNSIASSSFSSSSPSLDSSRSNISSSPSSSPSSSSSSSKSSSSSSNSSSFSSSSQNSGSSSAASSQSNSNASQSNSTSTSSLTSSILTSQFNSLTVSRITAPTTPNSTNISIPAVNTRPIPSTQTNPIPSVVQPSSPTQTIIQNLTNPAINQTENKPNSSISSSPSQSSISNSVSDENSSTDFNIFSEPNYMADSTESMQKIVKTGNNSNIQEKNSENNNSTQTVNPLDQYKFILIPLGILAAGGAGFAVWTLYKKHKKE